MKAYRFPCYNPMVSDSYTSLHTVDYAQGHTQLVVKEVIRDGRETLWVNKGQQEGEPLDKVCDQGFVCRR